MADLLTDDLKREFLDAFSLFDSKNEGEIQTSELKSLLMLLGMAYSDSELEKLILEVDEDGSGSIDAGEFLALMTRLMRDQDIEDEITEAFKPVDDQLDGWISVGVLHECLEPKDAVKRIFPLTVEEVREHLIRTKVYIRHDDKIEYGPFVRKMLLRVEKKD